MVYEFHQDDPRKCTSAKLRKFHLVTKLRRIRDIPAKSIVLNPNSSQTLSRNDHQKIEHHGLVALDCSWKLSDNVFNHPIQGENRRLPTLLAGNPTNYSIPEKLSTVEALAAALYITGFTNEAGKILSIFKWGNTFLSLNKEALDTYSETVAENLPESEREYFGPKQG